MKDKKQPFGYTIVEVMIVLAVSSMLFLMATIFINGKQAKTSFTSGANEMSSRIQDVVEQVNRGKYSDVKLECTVNIADNNVTVSTVAPKKQGANPPCIFLGKFIHFPNPADPQKYQIYSLAGTRNALSLDQAKITAITSGDADLTVNASVPQGLTVESVKVDGNSTRSGFGFVQGLGTKSEDDKGYASGSQNISMVYLENVANPREDANIANQINSTNVKVAKTAVICITDGTRYGTITIGDKNNQYIARTQLGLSSCPS